MKNYIIQKVPQDLHMHTIFSSGDGAVMPQQTPELIAEINHAEIRGISDHIEYLEDVFADYKERLTHCGFYIGAELDGSRHLSLALDLELEYHVYHCYDKTEDYQGVEKLLQSGKPLIIAHPIALDTDLSRLPSECLIEINNRYVWRNDYLSKIMPFRNQFNFVISSDAHQPNWLNQNAARYAAAQMGIQESLIF